jgi:hypothetical protein
VSVVFGADAIPPRGGLDAARHGENSQLKARPDDLTLGSADSQNPDSTWQGSCRKMARLDGLLSRNP